MNVIEQYIYQPGNTVTFQCLELLYTTSNRLDSARLANISGITSVLLVRIRVRRALHSLAQLRHSLGLPALDRSHSVEEEVRRFRGVHIGGNVFVDAHALLEDANAVVVGSDSVVRDLQRSGNVRIGVFEHAGLSQASGDGSLASVGGVSAEFLGFGLGDDGAGVGRLHAVEMGEVSLGGASLVLDRSGVGGSAG